MNKKVLILFLIFLSFGNLYPRPKVEFLTNPYKWISPNVLQTQIKFDPNNIDTWIQNTGIFNQDIRTSNTPGMMWPKGSNKFAIFTTGLSMGAYINNQLRLASASYKGEYAPGYIEIVGGIPTPRTNLNFKLYKVTKGDTTSADYINWGFMVPYGAPYVDVNNNGVWDAGIDKPGIRDAEQTVFICMTDGFQENHSASEGFSGGTTPMYSEIHLTAWGYKGDSLYAEPLNDIQYLSFDIINKSTKDWINTAMGIVTDTDLGDATDDYIGCDTTLNLSYCYNSDNFDGTGNSPSYGANPPAVGFDYILSPLTPTGNNNDSVVIYDPPGSNNRIVKKGYKQIGMTSFMYFTGTGSGGIQCEADPSMPIEAYRFLNGMKKDGASWFHPSTKQRVKKVYTGNPESGEGWTEYGYNGNINMATIKNCLGGDSVTTYFSPPGDRRYTMNTGGNGFTFYAGDTQRVVLAQIIARGYNNKNAVTKLKSLSRTAQMFYELNFDVKYPIMPVPEITKSILPLTPTTCGLNIYWNDAAEYYKYNDTVFHLPSENNTYTFQGYEVYEVSRDLQPANLPDFTRPSTINPNNIKLVKIFDKRDNTGIVIDTLPLGVFINGNELYAGLPIVPPYGLGTPSDFPESGLSRLVQINQTQFPQNYGGVSAIQYGQMYKFIVCAYAVSGSSNPKRKFKVLRNNLGSALFEVIPKPYPESSTFYFRNSDTINTNRRDLGLKPVVVGQEYLQNAIYRVFFNTPDTTYSILKSTNSGASFYSLKDRLKALPYTKSHDSSRIFDGILLKTEMIKSYNRGIIKDPTAFSDSIQTRKYGWDYLPSNQYVTGSKYYSTYPYQSKSMSMTFPTMGTFNNVKSLLRYDQLRKVKIVFSNVNKQYAYRYLDTSRASDAFFMFRGMTEVPFQVYMTDSTATRQLNCAFVESNDVLPATGQWAPGADTLGRKLLLYVFNSSYDTSVTSYKTKNLYISLTIDVMYVWAPRLLNAGANFTEGDSLIIYPYTVTMPGVMYEFSTKAPIIPIVEPTVPVDYELYPNYPNPFNNSTTIRFGLPKMSYVTIKVYNILGQMVKLLADNQRFDAGVQRVSFTGNNLSSGVYFYTIQTEKFKKSRRMVLVK